jgi:biotin transport system substrate-specific component
MTNRRTTARDLAQIAIFAALIAALGLPGTITVGSTGVPITLQTLGIMLAGGILGARKGFLSVLVFLVLVSAGLPLLAGGRGGLGVWAGPSAGYLIGWLVGAAVIGALTAKILPAYPLWLGIVINIVGGVLVVYACGVAVLAFRIGFVPAVTSNFLYLPGDGLKVLVASIVIKQVHRAYPGLIGPAATGELVPADAAVPSETAAPAEAAVPTDAAAHQNAPVDGAQPADGPRVKP